MKIKTRVKAGEGADGGVTMTVGPITIVKKEPTMKIGPITM